MKKLANKVAVVTGAGSGMGKSLALLLAKKGCSVAISDIDGAALENTAASLSGVPVKVTTHSLDVADRLRMQKFADQVLEDHGKVNLLFNNAGVSVTNTVEKMDYEDFEWLMNINFWGVVHGCKAFLPYLQQTDEAHIVNTSSIFGMIAVPSQAAYNASKFAVRGFSEALRQELKDSHIRVTCVHPGGVKTNIVKSSRFVPEDNQSLTKEEFVSRFEQLANLTADEAAETIIRGIQKNKARILVGRDALLISILERIAPVSYSYLTSLFFNRD